MKKLVAIFLIFICGILNSTAQPNGGFENWHTEYSYQIPDNWQTENMLSILTPNPLSVFKATGIDKHSGNYAVKLKTIYVSNNPYPNIIQDTVGVIFTGKINTSPPSIIYGYPYVGRPAKLEFYSKYFPVGNDYAMVTVGLFKWNGTSRDTIAFNRMQIPPSASYNHYIVNLGYNSSVISDSAFIGFSSSWNDTARQNSTLYLDDVAFIGWVGIEEHNFFSDKVKIFPNPAAEIVNIIAEVDEANNVKVIDDSGKEIGIFKIQNYRVSINTSLFAVGFYFYEIRDKKDQILTNGKFNVIR